MSDSQLSIRHLGLQDYTCVWKAMSRFTDERDSDTPDELWLVQHSPVFTQGQAGKPEHLLSPGDIPVVQVDRGGQVTYHGPGQLVGYPLIDIKRRKLGVRELVNRIEAILVAVLEQFQLKAYSRQDAPGVYIDEKKIASLGLRVRRGCSFHGFSVNIDMDLEPFERINPCGYSGLMMTQLTDITSKSVDFHAVEQQIIKHFISEMGYAGQLKVQNPDAILRDKFPV